mgnify:CR=1 FL=1
MSGWLFLNIATNVWWYGVVLMHYTTCCVSVKNKKKRGQKNFINERILKYYKRM